MRPGQVVGTLCLPGGTGQRAVLWENGALLDLARRRTWQRGVRYQRSSARRWAGRKASGAVLWDDLADDGPQLADPPGCGLDLSKA